MKHTMECLLCYLFGLAPKFQPMEDSAKANEMRNPVYYSMYISDLQQGKGKETWSSDRHPKNKLFVSQNNSIHFQKERIQRVPALRAFWDLEKTVLQETRVSWTVLTVLCFFKFVSRANNSKSCPPNN